MTLKVLTLVIGLFISFGVVAQFETTSDSGQTQPTHKTPVTKKPKNKTNPSDRVVVGGGLDLRFGDITVIGVTPLVGYKVSDELLVGGIVTFRYFQENYAPNRSETTYGISPFARYTFFRGLFVHAEYEMLKGRWDYFKDPFWINSFFVGGGYSVPIGNQGFFGAYLLWNLTEDPNYIIYNQPVLRFSFGVGI